MTSIHFSRTSRRGVILLLVLGLMTMFAMLVLTFMVVTSHSYRVAASAARKDVIVDYKDQTVGAQDTWAALTELLLGSTLTPIGNHGLLENLYGHPVLKGRDVLQFEVTSGAVLSDRPIIRFYLTSALDVDDFRKDNNIQHCLVDCQIRISDECNSLISLT